MEENVFPKQIGVIYIGARYGLLNGKSKPCLYYKFLRINDKGEASRDFDYLIFDKLKKAPCVGWLYEITQNSERSFNLSFDKPIKKYSEDLARDWYAESITAKNKAKYDKDIEKVLSENRFKDLVKELKSISLKLKREDRKIFLTYLIDQLL
jgi:hypothetical protein